MTWDPRKNGRGLTSRLGLYNGPPARPTAEAVLAALVSPATKLRSVKFSGDVVHVTLLVEDVLRAAAPRPAVRVRAHEGLRVPPPPSAGPTRMPSRSGPPAEWW